MAALRVRGAVETSAVLLALYVLLAYGVVPGVWRRSLKRHPALVDSPRVTRTPLGIPGDPVNIALVGTEAQTLTALLLAGWHPADPITLASSLRIARSTVFHRPYEDAPVSTLLLWGRKQDLAFEQEIGHDPRERHHVRFWRSPEVDDEGRPVWFGAATLDRSVGFSHTTGQVTHHISPNIDAERDKIVADLQGAGAAKELDWVDGFHETQEGRNGGGDAYHTDGRLAVLELQSVSPP
jgi:hypothetical protein